jgi:hypothetical protein
MCYSSYKKCYTCPAKFDYHIVLCRGGKKALCCLDAEKAVDGVIVVRIKVVKSTHDPDGEPRMCGQDTAYAVEDPFAAMMETRESGGDCPKCVAEGRSEPVLVRSTPSVKRRKIILPVKRRRSSLHDTMKSVK